MSDSESDEEYTEENVVLETPVKEKKKRAPRKLNEEQKAKALENLRKGREKANAIKKAKKEGKEYVEPVKEEPKKKAVVKKQAEEDIDDIEETTIIQKPKKIKKKQRKIILQTESDSDSDDDCIVIKTKGRKKKPLPVEKPVPIVEQSLPKPELIRTPPEESPFQMRQRLKMEQIHKNAEMMMTQFN
jgi:hypothetical protein